MSLFQTVTASWSPPSPIIRKERGVSAPTPPQKQPLLALPAAPSSPPPAQGTAPHLGLTCFCFCLAWGEKRQRLVTVKWGPPPGTPTIPLGQDLPLPKEGGGDRRLPLSPRPEALPALLGKKGVSERWGPRGEARGSHPYLAFCSCLSLMASRRWGLGMKAMSPPSFTRRPIHQSLLYFWVRTGHR